MYINTSRHIYIYTFIYIYIYIYISYVCISILYLPIYQYLSICLMSIYLSIYRSNYLSTYLPTHLSIYLSIYLSVYLSVLSCPVLSWPGLAWPGLSLSCLLLSILSYVFYLIYFNLIVYLPIYPSTCISIHRCTKKQMDYWAPGPTLVWGGSHSAEHDRTFCFPDSDFQKGNFDQSCWLKQCVIERPTNGQQITTNHRFGVAHFYRVGFQYLYHGIIWYHGIPVWQITLGRVVISFQLGGATHFASKALSSVKKTVGPSCEVSGVDAFLRSQE